MGLQVNTCHSLQQQLLPATRGQGAAPGRQAPLAPTDKHLHLPPEAAAGFHQAFCDKVKQFLRDRRAQEVIQNIPFRPQDMGSFHRALNKLMVVNNTIQANHYFALDDIH